MARTAKVRAIANEKKVTEKLKIMVKIAVPVVESEKGVIVGGTSQSQAHYLQCP